MDLDPHAREYLERLHNCTPRHLNDDVNATYRGVGFVLSFLERANCEVYAGDLASELGVSTARIAALLNKMEKNDLISRRPSSEDGRRTVVQITAAGTEVIDSMRTKALQRISVLLARMPREDLDEYIRLSEQINDLLNE